MGHRSKFISKRLEINNNKKYKAEKIAANLVIQLQKLTQIIKEICTNGGILGDKS